MKLIDNIIKDGLLNTKTHTSAQEIKFCKETMFIFWQKLGLQLIEVVNIGGSVDAFLLSLSKFQYFLCAFWALFVFALFFNCIVYWCKY